MRFRRPPNPFTFLLAPSRREQYLAQYVLRENGRGRALEEILADPYIRNRATSNERARLLERPDVVAAVGEQTIAEMKRSLQQGRAAAA
jgi:hypothetical protein